jgi:3',5'-cyclic AMP phosphodiesterase CpdA
MTTLAHFSDLPPGASPAHERAVASLVASLRAERVDHVVVTGDVTDGGASRSTSCSRRSSTRCAARAG